MAGATSPELAPSLLWLLAVTEAVRFPKDMTVGTIAVLQRRGRWQKGAR